MKKTTTKKIKNNKLADILTPIKNGVYAEEIHQNRGTKKRKIALPLPTTDTLTDCEQYKEHLA